MVSAEAKRGSLVLETRHRRVVGTAAGGRFLLLPPLVRGAAALLRSLTARRAHNTINIQMLFLAHFSGRRGAEMDVTLLCDGNELRSHAARLSSG